ncbi:unnamed protein product [Lymnaea stagnalis]|uniref:Aerolysin-like C-terminal domain-containing protein n=1 Tax=Lymnaea stagnalis TaxID=6523 RepID=A0AAV2HPX3_LYMST
MKGIGLSLLILLNLLVGGQGTCSMTEWLLNFDKEGHSQCEIDNTYIRGFYRSARWSWSSDDGIGLIEGAQCCSPNSPWTSSGTQTVFADWTKLFDNNNVWANCPAGYFLQGLYRSGQFPGLLHNIEDGRCTKPADHPNYYGQCYDEDISVCFDDKGLCKCKDDYLVAGLYRGTCDNLYCLETLKCCKMADKPEDLDDLYKVKSRVMDTTMSDIAFIASYLGYGWCAGCRALYTGEDFRRDGDTWRADKSRACQGYMNEQRLAMAYGDWGFSMKDIKYGDPVIEYLKPESIDSGTIYNNDNTKVTKSIHRSQTSVRRVTHTKTSSWKNGHELGLTFSYTPSFFTGGSGFSASYNFYYESSSRVTDETNNQQSNTFTVNSSKTIKPYSAAKWDMILSKVRTTVTYTATIVVKFSTELQGFMRWGGGPYHPRTNYHYQYHGSGDRPTVNYRFGDSKVPFYTALKRESDTNSRPWMWYEMKHAYSDAADRIDDLANDERYIFTLSGKFEEVRGKRVVIHWRTTPLNGTHK